MTASKIVRREAAPVDDLPAELHPLLARIYSQRGIRSASELDLGLAALLPVMSLGQVDAAAELLVEALDKQWRIIVVGDFDADGATSTALVVSVLRQLQADIHYLVPNRFEYGYGLTPEIVAVASEMHPDLVITVDNGIASLDGVAAARAAGMRVLVTDHHLPADELPDADVIVNPNAPGDQFSSKSLAGVGVAFYVMAALLKRLGGSGWFERQKIAAPNSADMLDLVALGTVADVVPLDHNNRILIEQGLRRIRAGQARPGILALCRVSGRVPDTLVSGDLGYALGPRLNAAGRLEDMSVGIECLLAKDEETAMRLAVELDQLNRQRREIEDEMKQQALDMVDTLCLEDASEVPPALVLYQEDWHQGVVGIVASRIKERWHRPVIAFAADGEGRLKGSARSIQGVHMRDVLDAVSKREKDLIVKFGGHAMAAGLTLKAGKLDRFSTLFVEEVRRWVSDEDLRGIHYSDGPVPAEYHSLEVAGLLKHASPWGQHYPEPSFDGEFLVEQSRIVGVNHLKMRLSMPARQGVCLDAIAFGMADEHALQPGMCVRMLYQLDINRYMGRESVQLIVRHMELVEN